MFCCFSSIHTQLGIVEGSQLESEFGALSKFSVETIQILTQEQRINKNLSDVVLVLKNNSFLRYICYSM